MRKILTGLLLAATMATPVATMAQPSGAMLERYERQGQRNQARVDRQQAREARQRPQRVEQRSQRAEQRAARPAQQPVAVAQQDRRGPRGDRGRGGGREAYRQHIDATREASRRSAEGLSPRYQQRAAENQRNYERQVRRGDRDWRDDRRDARNDRRWDRNDRRWDRNDRRDWSRSWNRGWRNDNRYDWQRWRYSNRNHFRVGRYYPPYRGYSYSRFGIGAFLTSGLYAQNYWLRDPWSYRLPAAPYGTQWVRYYDDVLLVDVYSGEVIDVIHDFFW